MERYAITLEFEYENDNPENIDYLSPDELTTELNDPDTVAEMIEAAGLNAGSIGRCIGMFEENPESSLF